MYMENKTSFPWQVHLTSNLHWQISPLTSFSLTSVLVQKLACFFLNKGTCQGKTCHILPFTLPRKTCQGKLASVNEALIRSVCHERCCITRGYTSLKTPQNFVSPESLAKFMQQRSFREFRLENESKWKKPNKQTSHSINKQGLRCDKKETLHHSAITKQLSSVFIIISNGNRTEWSPIRSVIIWVITKSDDRAAGVRFVYHEYDYRPNWTTRSPIVN